MNELLIEILNAREARAERQRALLSEYGYPVVSFTMNIAGPVKTSPLIRRAFDEGLAKLEQDLAGCILSNNVIHAVTGDEALLSVRMDADELKSICTSIEEATPMGRLFDMDVLDADGNKLARNAERSCLVCGAPGRGCASRRLHSVAELQAATTRLLTGHFAETIANAAVDALLEEVRTTPKPGLVDLRNNGSHSDMDAALFTASAGALRPSFARFAAIGLETADLPPAEVFPLLRDAGIEAEAVMYAATGGVNTHKGAIYTLGILCAAVGRLIRTEATLKEADILSLCAAIAGDAARSDLERSDADTAGLRLYRTLGLPGIRGEMAAGLPSVASIALPAYRAALARGQNQNDAGVIALLHLIAHVRDTNLFHRGGIEGAQFAACSARALLETEPTMAQVEALDDAFIAQNLSPGGCADLLAAAYFLEKMLK